MTSSLPWQRLDARWTAPPKGAPDAPGTALFELIDGERLLELRPAPPGGDDGTGHQGWTTFTFRQGHPAKGAQPPAAPYLLVVRVVADEPQDRVEFRRWLVEEHGPRQVTIAGVRWLQAFEEDGPSHSFLNLWGIDDPSVVAGDAWKRVRDTQWWRRVAHLTDGADRGVYRTVKAPPSH